MTDPEGNYYGDCQKCGDKVIGQDSGCKAGQDIYHVKCFTCVKCGDTLRGKQYYSVNDEPYCDKDYLDTLEKCDVCAKPITERILRATGKVFHPDCFRCTECDKVLDNVPYTVSPKGEIHCIEDYHQKYAPRCDGCKQPIVPGPGQKETVRVVLMDKSFHVNCYKCEDCDLVLSSDASGPGCYPLDGHILCKECNQKRVQK